jgi:hypothetical protein
MAPFAERDAPGIASDVPIFCGKGDSPVAGHAPITSDGC